jgi:phytol kinase
MRMSLLSDIVPAVIVSGLYLLIFVTAELWRSKRHPPTEVTRKFVHFTSGAVCLSFSYIFSTHWTVLLLSILFMIIIVVTRKFGLLQSVHDVERSSEGGIYYPAAVYCTFTVAHKAGHPEFYLIAFLVLAVSDSLAALVGGRYGFKLYRVEEHHRRSLEGSVIFYFTTYQIILLGLLALSEVGRIECIIIAAYIALIVTAFEAISLGGADNLFIPLGTLAILLRVVNSSLPALGLRLGIVGIIFWMVYYISRSTNVIRLSGIIGIALAGYGALMLVRWDWIFPVIIGLFLFNATDLFVESSIEKAAQYRIRPVFYVLVVSFIWILAASFVRLPTEVFFVPYIVNLAANFSILWKRKANIDPDGYYLPLPQFIRNAPLLFRAPVLTLLFASVNLFTWKSLNPLLTLTICFSGVLIVEGIYWRMEKGLRGILSDMQFLRMTSFIIMGVSVVLCLISMPWYYPEIFTGGFFR